MSGEVAVEKEGIKIVDRRRFTATGELRTDAPPEPEMPPPPLSPPKAPPATTTERKEPQSSQAFMSFIASLATNALAAMGALPEARARGLPINSELAREYVDILAMLDEKTRGNLTRDEAATLKRLVSDLRLQYVELVKRTAKK